MINPTPTTRFVLEPSLVCNIKCKFCYHLHKYDTWKNTVKSFEKVKQIIDDGKRRGNDYMDITGGEPTIYPHICETIKYTRSIGIRSCIITNGIVSRKQTQKILDSGIDDFLVSRHGLRETHDFITNCEGSYDKQVAFLNQISANITFRFNCVISKFNENDIFKIAVELSWFKPRIVNFINMNPFHEWMQKDMETSKVVADLRKVESLLNNAIEYLEDKGIGVNVRYYPMCRLAEEYRRCICNDLQVMFALIDPKTNQDNNCEWDYSTLPKTIERYYEWGRVTSNNNEERGEPCNQCDLQWVCGGGNRHFNRVASNKYGQVFDKQIVSEIKNLSQIEKMWYYRQHNTMTLIPR